MTAPILRAGLARVLRAGEWRGEYVVTGQERSEGEECCG
jgi:hypothetical protein